MHKFIILGCLAVAAAQFTAKWQVKIGVTPTKHQGDFGNIEGATALCNVNQAEPWYPILYNSSGMNPDVLAQILGKEQDEIVIRLPSNRLVPTSPVLGQNITDLFFFKKNS